MDQSGGCCIARYGGGDYGVSKMDMIMQRYRPIAPKPTPSGGSSSPPVERSSSDSRGSKKTGRGRKRGALAKENTTRKKKLSATSAVHDKTVVTLPLLPETPDLNAVTSHGQKNLNLPVWLSFDQGGKKSKEEKGVVWSTVMVERVTATWVEEDVLGGTSTTDEEKMRRLEEDTCPGFVSDGWNRVVWTNRAYREMARKTASFEGGEEEEVVVWVVMKEAVVPVTCEAYTCEAHTCRVRVQSTWKERESGCSASSSAVTLPCDVWRMRSGGFAWRLDVNAALRLGR